MKKLRIIVSGYIGLYPSGGVTWDYIQYPLGLYLLGHDVYYFEDTHQYPVFQNAGSKWDDCTASVDYLRNVMKNAGLEHRWAYRDEVTGNWFGLKEDKVAEILKTADVFINVSSSTYLWQHDYDHIPIKVLVDSDPMFTQVQFWDDEREEESTRKITSTFRWYTHLFSFGENISQPDCLIPDFNCHWRATRQPICLGEWANLSPIASDSPFTTVMNWSARSDMNYKHEQWGQKDIEFLKFRKVPSHFTKHPFEIVVSCAIHAKAQFPDKEIRQAGWKLFSPEEKIDTPCRYKAFIAASAGEFSVAKETYVKSKSGWFSCRWACYLAASRPVVTQETGWSKYIPAGEGLFAFHTEEEALDGLKKVSSDFSLHTKTARQIAHDFFDSNKVLQQLLNQL